MKISRLDQVINNNVTSSAKFNQELQKIYILQDISETLAMIYDKLCDSENNDAFVIPFNKLENYKTMFFEPVDCVGYEVEFIKYDDNGNYVTVAAFNGDMRLSKKDYEKKYRLWNIEPSEKEMSDTLWEK